MKRITLLVVTIFCFFSFAQETKLSIEDATLGYYKNLYPQSKYYLNWVKNADLYTQYDIEKQQLIITDASNQQIISSVSLNDLQKSISNLQYIPEIKHIDTQFLVLDNNNIFYRYDYKNHNLTHQIHLDNKAENAQYNPLANAIAYTIENNLFLATPEQKSIAITNYSDTNIVSGQSIHRNEFGIHKGIFWSPKGNFIAFYQKDETDVTQYPLVNIHSTPAQPILIKYPMAGQKSEKAKVGIYNLNSQQTIYLDIDTSDEHYLTNLSWSPDEKYILLAEINREQNHYDLNRYDVQTGKKINTILSEHNDKWVEPEHSAYFIPNKNDTFLWISEKDGFANVYQVQFNGKQKQITQFKWVVKDILGFSSNGQSFFISATGQDPRQTHTYQVYLKNGKTRQLTLDSGTHQSSISPSGNYFINQYNSIQTANVIDIISVNNLKKQNLLTASNPLKDYNLGQIEFITLTADDGKTPLYGKIIKPKNFNPNKKYPVLVYVYGGPHAQLVTNSWLAGTDLWMLAFSANEDYIIFTLDNRGSAHRGFEFESIIHRNLATYAVKDQLTGVNYLKSLPYVDSKRLSVYGWSFGGFLTSSLMLESPDTFKVGVAGGAVIDWKFYEVMYGERYMDTPEENPQGYEQTSILNKLQNLKGKLLYLHGYIDDVVLMQHLMAVSRKAVEQGKHLDVFIYPTHKHNVSGLDRVHMNKHIAQYILQND